ncbi:MAG: phage tail tape measure protein, partial [Raoultibacter sp.]
TAVLGGFADAGIKGSDAGTSLKTMLQRLAAPTEKAADMVAALGINVRDSDGIMLDAAGVAQELQDKLGGLSSAEKDMAMQTIFGSDASRAALVVTNLGREGIEKYTAATNDQNAAQRLADSQMGDSQRAIEEMKGAIETAAIKLGTSLSPSIVGVAEAVGEAAEKFSSMDEETQQAIVQAVALSAVLGPVLMLFGKGVKTIEGFGRGLQTMAKFFANVDIKTSSASRSLDGYSAATKTSSAATTGLAGSTRAASVAMGGLKTAIIGTGIGALVVTLGMAIGLVMEFVDANNKAADRTRRAGEANNALRRSLDSLDSGFETAKSAASDYSVTADEVRTKTEDMTQAHKDLADSLTDSMSEAGSNAGMLESYMGIIESLGTKSNLTGEEQAKLKEAVAKVNDACGTSFQITNDQNGALYGQVDAIRAVVSAQQERIRYEAASEGWKDVLKQQESDLLEITRLEQQRNDLAEKNKGKTVAEQGENAKAYTETVNALGSARDAYNATSETAKLYEQRVGELGAGLGSSAAEIVEFASASAIVAESLGASGQSLDAFAGALSQCGVSTAELSSLTEDQLAALVQSYDGSTQSIVSKLQEFGLTAKVEGKSASSNLATGISEGTQQVLQAASGVTGKTIEQIGAECTSFGIEGDAAIAAYATALANGSTQAAAAAAATGAASGDATGQNYADALAAKRELAVASALQVTGMTLEQFNASAAQAGVEGDEATAAYAASLGERAWDAQEGGAVVAGSATAGMGTGDPSAGGQLGSLFSSGVADNAWNSKIAGESLAGSASDGAQSQNWNASSWGAHLGDNFASGISGAIEWVSNAATSLADAVWSVLGHTVPKEGPLRNGGKGETEWGAHTVQNYVSGIRSQIPELKKAMNEVSAATASPLSLTEKIRLGTPASAARAKLAAAQSVNTSSVSNDNRKSAVTINVSVQGGNEQSARAIAQEIYTLEQRAARGMRR